MSKTNLEEEKTEFNARAKASMLAHLKSKSWADKVESIERMNQAAAVARDAMKRARQSRPAHDARD